jgi:hypothetical protein
MIDRIKSELIAKRDELRRKNNLRSLEVINWIEDLLKMLEDKPEPVKKEIKVELPEESVEEVVEEKKPTPKRKIVFKKK